MRVLLVGGNSSLAQCLRPVLAGFAEVVTAGRNDCDLELDLNKITTIPSGFDSVVNTAAHLGGPNPAKLESAEATNALGTLALGRACAEAGVDHLVHVSTIFATLPASSPFHNAYALSKRHGDEALQLQARMQDMQLTILRPSQFYGVGESYRRNQPFLFTLMDKAQSGQDIELWGKHDALRNFIHVQDVANIIARVVLNRALGTYTVSSPQDQSFHQIAQAAVDAFESSSTIHFLHDKPDTADNIFTFKDTLYRTLGYTPQIDINRGMQMEPAHRRNTK
jgi:nucleoside-diphosphate-sugar epimerase